MERRSSLVGLARPAFIAVGPPPYASSATCVDRMSTLALPCPIKAYVQLLVSFVQFLQLDYPDSSHPSLQ